jgi:regulator of cell morphogenesis and NO signaling
MSQVPHHCSMMSGSNVQVTLCEPLAQLKREHGPLMEQMDAFAREATEIGMDQEKTDWRPQLAKLKEKVDAFVRELDPHSEREEGTLFPLMAKYIGRQVGPIAVMEYEHDTAKQNLKKFGEAMEQVEGPVDAARAKEIVSYALQAHAVLTDHFMKEEHVLFPMAENMLNAEEKEELSRAFGLS